VKELLKMEMGKCPRINTNVYSMDSICIRISECLSDLRPLSYPFSSLFLLVILVGGSRRPHIPTDN
jgi:hypothetical protein